MAKLLERCRSRSRLLLKLGGLYAGRRQLGDATSPREEQERHGGSHCWELFSASHRASDSFALLDLADNFIFQPEAEETWETSVLDLNLFST